MACAEARSVGPSKIPHPSEPGVPLWMHLNSWPDRSTPMSRTGLSLASTSWLPTTRSESPEGGEPEELLLVLAVAPLLVLVDVLVLAPVPVELPEDVAPPVPDEPLPVPVDVLVDEPLEDVVPPVPEELVLVPDELLVPVLVDVVVPEELLLVLV
jgi:hypothetical protein